MNVAKARNSMWPKVPPAFVRQVLAGHSALGLAAAALIYLICLTGTVAVFAPDLERWEQPDAPEFTEMAPGALNRASQAGAALWAATPEAKPPAEYLYMQVPTAERPRLSVGIGEHAWLAQADGRIWDEVRHEWTHLVEHLHIFLTLPEQVGLAAVGIIGVALSGLILSGLAAHPRIFRDAFAFRWKAAPRLSEADLHNRLSVWAAPFHLVVAVTGAFIGLSSVTLYLTAALFHGGDMNAAGAALFGAAPKPDNAAAPWPDLDAGYAEVRRLRPDATPNLVSIQRPGTRARQAEVSAALPGRLIYAERYLIDDQGRVTGRIGNSDGPLGRQVYASSFPVHFGSFGGAPVRIAYGLLGLSLCVVVCSGINIWLIRRRDRGQPAPRLHRAWIAVVWGTPLALALAALGEFTLRLPVIWTFWGVLLALIAAAPFIRSEAGLSRSLRVATAVLILAALAAHGARFGADAFGPAALVVSLCLTATALALGASALRRLA